MVVERAFGIRKGRLHILLKRNDLPPWNLPDIISACLCLYNLCILEAGEFDMD
jgi:hypothetical protein